MSPLTSDELKQHINNVLSQIPSGKSGTISGGYTSQGLEISFAERWKALTVGAYAQRPKTGGWSYGIAAGFSW